MLVLPNIKTSQDNCAVTRTAIRGKYSNSNKAIVHTTSNFGSWLNFQNHLAMVLASTPARSWVSVRTTRVTKSCRFLNELPQLTLGTVLTPRWLRISVAYIHRYYKTSKQRNERKNKIKYNKNTVQTMRLIKGYSVEWSYLHPSLLSWSLALGIPD
jgi:hypothetical protein